MVTSSDLRLRAPLSLSLPLPLSLSLLRALSRSRSLSRLPRGSLSLERERLLRSRPLSRLRDLETNKFFELCTHRNLCLLPLSLSVWGMLPVAPHSPVPGLLVFCIPRKEDSRIGTVKLWCAPIGIANLHGPAVRRPRSLLV